MQFLQRIHELTLQCCRDLPSVLTHQLLHTLNLIELAAACGEFFGISEGLDLARLTGS